MYCFRKIKVRINIFSAKLPPASHRKSKVLLFCLLDLKIFSLNLLQRIFNIGNWLTCLLDRLQQYYHGLFPFVFFNYIQMSQGPQKCLEFFCDIIIIIMIIFIIILLYNIFVLPCNLFVFYKKQQHQQNISNNSSFASVLITDC